MLAVAVLLAFFSIPAAAATFRVNASVDVNDLEPGNGLCVAYLIVFPPFVLPFCTLRAAIEEANALPGPDQIILPAGTYTLTIAGINEDLAASGDLDITDDLVLSGAGADETLIDGNALDRVLDLHGANTGITVSGVTIGNGLLPPDLSTHEAGGGGIRNGATLFLRQARLRGNRAGGDAPSDAGGGLSNSGSCTAENVSVEGNRAACGGGIANQTGATLKLRASTVSGNRAAAGGGLFNGGSATAINATVSGNRAEGGNTASGGGIVNRGELSIVHATVADNLAAATGGGIHNESLLNLVNTLLAGNIGGNCTPAAPPNSLGHNLDSDRTCSFSTAGDLNGIDPRLDRLAPHGGPTATHGLLLGSPAVDQGRDLRAEGIATDQRGVPRPQGKGVDIGAFETGPRSLTPLLAPLLLTAD